MRKVSYFCHKKKEENDERKKNDKFLQQNLKIRGRATGKSSLPSFTEEKKENKVRKVSYFCRKCKSKFEMPTPRS